MEAEKVVDNYSPELSKRPQLNKNNLIIHKLKQ